MVKNRNKKVILTKHYFEQAYSRKLFSTEQKAEKYIKKALKRIGVIIRETMDECEQCCVFRSDKGMIVTAPFIEKKRCFIVKTVWEANDRHRKLYLREKRKIKQGIFK